MCSMFRLYIFLEFLFCFIEGRINYFCQFRYNNRFLSAADRSRNVEADAAVQDH